MVPVNARLLEWRADGWESSTRHRPERAGARVDCERQNRALAELAILPDTPLEFSAFSPDGLYASFFTDKVLIRDNLWVVNLTTGTTCLVTDDPPIGIRPSVPDWSPTGRWLSYLVAGDSIEDKPEMRVFDADTCAGHPTTGKSTEGAQWSPNGTYLAVTERRRHPGQLLDAGGHRIDRTSGFRMDGVVTGRHEASERTERRRRRDGPCDDTVLRDPRGRAHRLPNLVSKRPLHRRSATKTTATPTEPGDSVHLRSDLKTGEASTVWAEELGIPPDRVVCRRLTVSA